MNRLSQSLAGPLSAVLAGLLVLAGPASRARAQAAPPSPAETHPLSTTTVPDTSKLPPGSAAPAPEQSLGPRIAAPPSAPAPASPPAPPSPAQTPAPAPAPGAPGRQTLVPTPGETNDVDAVTLPAKPAVVLAGSTKWEEAVPSLKASFARIEAELAKAGLKPTGRPLAVFTKTEDDGFQYEAMIPVDAPADPKPALADGVHLGTTPSGKAMRFPHKGSYDEIDGTYETLTAYLDVKDVAVQDRFVEEYVTDLNDKADERLDVNIYALLK